MTLLNIVQTIIFWTVFILSVVFIPFFIPLSLLWTRNKERSYQSALRFCARLGLFLSFIKVKVFGLEKINPKQQFIIVSNHSSFLDSIILLAKLSINFKFTAYRAGFRLPLIKNIFEGAGYIGAGFRGEKMLVHSSRLISALKNKDNILIYSKLSDGQIQDFVMDLSKKFNIPILPVVLEGVSSVLPLNKYVFESGAIKVQIKKPRYF